MSGARRKWCACFSADNFYFGDLFSYVAVLVWVKYPCSFSLVNFIKYPLLLNKTELLEGLSLFKNNFYEHE